jgi:hypothetical protein
MGDLLNAAIRIGPLTLLVGSTIALISLLLHLTRADRSRLWFRVLRMATIGVLAFGGGTMAGIALFCSTASGGNLCGLGGIFGTGPFAAGLCLGCYAIFTHPARTPA